MERFTPLPRLPLAYLSWHYSAAWADLLRLFTNLAWFLYHFFSIDLLLPTLLSPWKRLHESRHGTAGLLGALILNLILLCFGFALRLFTICLGIASLALLALLFVAFLCLWVIMPVAPFLLLTRGLVGLIGL